MLLSYNSSFGSNDLQMQHVALSHLTGVLVAHCIHDYLRPPELQR